MHICQHVLLEMLNAPQGYFSIKRVWFINSEYSVFAFYTQYNPAHVQAMRQYQIQQEQLLRAQQQQQQNAMWSVPNSYSNADLSFRQYLQVKCESSITCIIFNILACPLRYFRCLFSELMGIFSPCYILIFLCNSTLYKSKMATKGQMFMTLLGTS